jgi:hypothetical protein
MSGVIPPDAPFKGRGGTGEGNEKEWRGLRGGEGEGEGREEDGRDY